MDLRIIKNHAHFPLQSPDWNLDLRFRRAFRFYKIYKQQNNVKMLANS